MSWAEIVPPTTHGASGTVGRSGVVTDVESCEHLLCWLDAGAHLVGANTAFDALVSVITAARRGLDWRRLMKAWIDAYEQGRVHDVFVRQKLLDLAAGCYRFEELPNGKWLNHQYNLAGLARRLTGRQLSKPAGEDDTDHWRLRFSELEGVPIAQYPREAYDYSLEDSIATAEVFVVQEVRRFADRRIQRNFPGKDPFVNEQWQTMCCVPLKAMAAYGLRTDGPSVERFATEVEAKIIEERADLVEAGLVREPVWHRDTAAIEKYIRTKELEAHFADPTVAQVPGQPLLLRLNKANYLASGDETLRALADWKNHCAELTHAGLCYVEHTRDTKAAARRAFEAYAERGEVAPRTDSYDEEKHGPLKDAAGRILENLNCISLDADSCAGSEDEILILYSSYMSLAKTVSNDLPMLRAGVWMPVHTRFEELLETGRTSSSKPNVQNVRRLPGIRECFVPRAGNVYIDTDFSMLELHTLAQVCQWVLGFSTLGEALRDGKDPHTMIAAKILSIDYAQAVARKEAGDSELDNARTAGKGCFHPDTEVLTRDGWVRVGALTMSSLVCSARFDGDVTTLEYAVPIALTERDWDGELVHLKNEGIDLRVTPDHRMVGWKRRSRKEMGLSLVTCLPEEVPALHYWPNAGDLSGENVVVNARLLRLAVAAQADANVEKRGGRLRFKFRKNRKTERLQALLGADCEAIKTSNGDTLFRLTKGLSEQVKALLDEKRLPYWWTRLAPDLREIVLTEARFWDATSGETQKCGSQRTGYTYVSTIEQNAEVLQTIATLTNRKTRMVRVTSKNPNHADVFLVSVKDKNRSRGGHVSAERMPYVGKVFCLTTHNDSVVVRDHGVPVITRQCNFGAAGGLSAKTFVVYAWTNYRIRLTLEKAQELLDVYHQTWVEMSSYFKWIKGLKDPYSVKIVVDKKTKLPREQCTYNVVQPWSGRLRARATYCAACNSPFQGLGSDVAKVALWLCWKATMGFSELGEQDPLFGARMVNFVHDSIMTEVEEARAHAAALRQKELMEVAGRQVLPLVPVKADIVVCRQWSKKAQQWREPCVYCARVFKCDKACPGVGEWKNRKLIPWDLRVACRMALAEFAGWPDAKRHAKVAELRTGGDKWKALDDVARAAVVAEAARLAPEELGLEYLKGKQWPSDVAREAVGEMFNERCAA